MIAATPTKLRSGDWGAKVQGTVSVGDLITITARSGKSWSATVSKVIWSGDGASIVATASRPSRSVSSSAAGGHYCGYPCPVSGRKCCAANGPCHDCE